MSRAVSLHVLAAAAEAAAAGSGSAVSLAGIEYCQQLVRCGGRRCAPLSVAQ